MGEPAVSLGFHWVGVRVYFLLSVAGFILFAALRFHLFGRFSRNLKYYPIFLKPLVKKNKCAIMYPRIIDPIVI
jgi:hypothetical protein